MTGMEENARQNPTRQLDILRALEEGDLVAVHSHVRRNRDDGGAALVHILPLRGRPYRRAGDIGQPVPAQSVNANGMF